MNIRDQLLILSEPDYQKFQSKLLPNTQNLIGVRLPNLRKIARNIAKDDWYNYLQHGQEDYFEEIMLKGLVIGYLNPNNIELDIILEQIQHFLPKIDNWSVCDSFCSTLKITKTYPEPLWNYINPLFQSTHPFTLRFFIVMLLNYYIDDSHLSAIFSIIDALDNDAYYVKMAAAWALSICYVKYPNETTQYLNNNTLDTFTYNKTLQKILESKQVNDMTKTIIRKIKQKT